MSHAVACATYVTGGVAAAACKGAETECNFLFMALDFSALGLPWPLVLSANC